MPPKSGYHLRGGVPGGAGARKARTKLVCRARKALHRASGAMGPMGPKGPIILQSRMMGLLGGPIILLLSTGLHQAYIKLGQVSIRKSVDVAGGAWRPAPRHVAATLAKGLMDN